MLREILRALRGHDVLSEMIAQIGEMLRTGKWMFEQAAEALLTEVDWNAMAPPLYAKDRQINEMEQKLRERIVTHLSLGHRADLPACLVLMSVVKDGERLGDYCKNLYEVVELLNEPLDGEEYAEYFGELDKDIVALFGYTREAVFNADEEKARMTWDVENRIAKLCDSIVDRVAKASLSTNRAVCFALIARHYKRIVAHLVNIATSSIVPLSDIDYFDERSLRESNANV